MICFRMALPAIVLAHTAGHALAALTLNSLPNTGAAPAGFVSNDITVDTDFDLITATIYIELATGIVYNTNPIVPGLENFQQSSGDTYITLGGNNTIIAGAAGDLGHQPLFNPVAQVAPRTIGASYFNLAADDIGQNLPLGTFSFSDDAAGKGRVYASNVVGEKAYFEFDINGGVLPGDFSGQLSNLPAPEPLPPLDPGPIDPHIPLETEAYFQVVDQPFFQDRIVSDLVVEAVFDWTVASLYIELDHGIAFDFIGTREPYDSEVFINFPQAEVQVLAYDSYVGMVDDDTSYVLGGADDFPGAGDFSLSGQRISAKWANNSYADFGTLRIGRISLSPDASGWATANFGGITISGPVVDGRVYLVPEPVMIQVLCLGALPLLLRRRSA